MQYMCQLGLSDKMVKSSCLLGIHRVSPDYMCWCECTTFSSRMKCPLLSFRVCRPCIPPPLLPPALPFSPVTAVHCREPGCAGTGCGNRRNASWEWWIQQAFTYPMQYIHELRTRHALVIETESPSPPRWVEGCFSWGWLCRPSVGSQRPRTSPQGHWHPRAAAFGR